MRFMRRFVLVFCVFLGSTAFAQSLTVGLYPYVPRLAQFQSAIQTEWKSLHPDVTLNFLSSSQWDGGYDTNPPADVDVYVFDAMYFDYFLSQHWLEPLAEQEIKNLQDFLPYAINGVKNNGTYYAIPQLGCANMLFYEKTDAALVAANTLSQVSQTLGQCTYTSQIPPDKRGLLVDMSGGTTDATLYLDATHSINGVYPFVLPQNASQLNQTAMQNLKKVLADASFENATNTPNPTTNPYQFAVWYSNGWGRAYMGYTESMSNMSDDSLSKVAFKPMPFSDVTTNQPMFYADVIAVHPSSSQRGTRALAVELANLMASTATMVASIGPTSEYAKPQYLMPTRPSIFNSLGQGHPVYNQMYNVVTSSNPLMFKVNSDVRTWTQQMKGVIKTGILSSPQCGCDFPSAQQITSNSNAGSICNTTCSSHGGWNGQWTNQYPAAQNGSVCGCNTCPAP